MRLAALDWSAENCTIGRSLEILGERWTLMVLREMFNGLRRFDEMRARTNIPRQVLSNRLALLVEHGILRRAPYQEPGARVRYEYRLTEKGMDLYPILVAIKQWGDRYVADPDGPTVLMEHRSCGAPIQVELRCADDHLLASAREVTARPGPGAKPRPVAAAGRSSA
jgi:DNA-binding HxlR family transcriptional regulator